MGTRFNRRVIAREYPIATLGPAFLSSHLIYPCQEHNVGAGAHIDEPGPGSGSTCSLGRNTFNAVGLGLYGSGFMREEYNSAQG